MLWAVTELVCLCVGAAGWQSLDQQLYTERWAPSPGQVLQLAMDVALGMEYHLRQNRHDRELQPGVTDNCLFVFDAGADSEGIMIMIESVTEITLQLYVFIHFADEQVPAHGLRARRARPAAHPPRPQVTEPAAGAAAFAGRRDPGQDRRLWALQRQVLRRRQAHGGASCVRHPSGRVSTARLVSRGAYGCGCGR